MVTTMSRVVVKVAYHNPHSATKSISGYAEYIATREGVELRNQDKERPKDTTYADYIAMRSGVETRGAHGLFTIQDRPISLSEVSKELKEHKGNVWTVIISLKKEDAVKTGYDNSEAWRELITDKANDIARDFNLPIDQMNCYAAFHTSKDHPHIHMIVYSKNPSVYSGYHKESSLQNLKSILTNEIFSEELSEIYKMKSGYRDELRKAATEAIRKLAKDVMANKNVSPEVIKKFNDLVSRLQTIEGRKIYGYLPKDAKDMVDDLLREISKEPKLSELYDKWCELKSMQQQFYNSKETESIPIEKNDEFKSIRNAIVKEATRITATSDTATQIAVDDIVDLLCQIYVSSADEFDLNQNYDGTVVEEQEEVDEALGIKHS